MKENENYISTNKTKKFNKTKYKKQTIFKLILIDFSYPVDRYFCLFEP